MENMVFYFTYGTDKNFPFRGGWTVVEAPDFDAAIALFRIYHPDKTPCIVNCASFYHAEAFEQTIMFQEGNFGARCHERITIQRVIN